MIPAALVAGSVLFLGFSVQSFLEKERRAGRISLGLAALCVVALVVFLILPRVCRIWITAVLGSLGLLVLGVLLLPYRKEDLPDTPFKRFDERDIPFSRMELQESTAAFRDYYRRRPDLLKTDEAIRKLPGLLNSDSREAHELGFAAAMASFDFCHDAGHLVEAAPAESKTRIEAEVLSSFIKSLAKYYGALNAGITKLEEYHLYSTLGRKERRGKPGDLSHSFALVFTVEMKHEHIASAPAVPVVMESSRQYAGAALIALQLTKFIARLGYDARAHIDGSYHIIAPLAARDAGLGEIGRMGLLMTPEHGPRVRIGAVTTDLPLMPDRRSPDRSMIRFCRICKRCADNCPSRAIPFEDRELIDGAYRWRIKMDSCFRYWNAVGTDCGRCIAVCPYAHPETGMHGLVRFILRTIPRSHRTLLWMENLFYGKRPRRGAYPEWIPFEGSSL
jgi:ferredoxin